MIRALGLFRKRPLLPLCRPRFSPSNEAGLDKIVPETSANHELNPYRSFSCCHGSIKGFAAGQRNVYNRISHYSYLKNNFAMAYSKSAKVKDLENDVMICEEITTMASDDTKISKKTMLLGVDHDILGITKELKEAQQEMMTNMKKCSRALFALGSIHAFWGGAMFFVLETPMNHAIATEICMSSVVVLGLAYQIKQTIKPIALYTKFEEHRLQGILFLSRQVSRMVGAFFHRGSGIGFVLSLTLTAHSLSCLRFLY